MEVQTQLMTVTNLAHAVQADSKTFSRVSSVVWMGGALDHPGNTSPVAEFNCFADPYAATQVIGAAKAGLFELYMAPLDITTPHQIPFHDLIHPSFMHPDGPPTPGGEAARNMMLTPIREFVSAMLLRVRGLQASFGLPDAMEMHDPVAVWFAIAHAAAKPGELEASWGIKERDFQVERTGEFTRGMCVVDRRGTGEDIQPRTKDDKLQGGAVPSLPPKDEKTDRMGAEVVKTKNLPKVITATPGVAELRQLILTRVFGEAA